MTIDNKNKLNNETDHKTYPCPRCQEPTTWKNNPFKPFCSKRCKLIDLGAWANEEYRVPDAQSSYPQAFYPQDSD